MRPYAENPGALYGQSVKRGYGEILPAVMDVFWADIYGQSTGPLGQMWTIATHKEIFLMENGKTGNNCIKVNHPQD
jgi:uncharacterized glyoxalase superfamily protein PhnB